LDAGLVLDERLEQGEKVLLNLKLVAPPLTSIQTEYTVATLPGMSDEQIVVMTHTAKDGSPKILRECELPLTGKACVNRIITDLGVLDVTEAGLVLVETAPGTTAAEIAARTAAEIVVPEGIGS